MLEFLHSGLLYLSLVNSIRNVCVVWLFVLCLLEDCVWLLNVCYLEHIKSFKVLTFFRYAPKEFLDYSRPFKLIGEIPQWISFLSFVQWQFLVIILEYFLFSFMSEIKWSKKYYFLFYFTSWPQFSLFQFIPSSWFPLPRSPSTHIFFIQKKAGLP